jgi:hypothetical protein
MLRKLLKETPSQLQKLKKLILVMSICMISQINHAQEIHWTLSPLNVPGSSEALLGTSSDDPLYLVTNNQKRVVLDTNGFLKINRLHGNGLRLLYADSNGVICARLGSDGDDPNVDSGPGPGPCPSNYATAYNPYDQLPCPSVPCLKNASPWYEGGNKVGTAESNEAGTCNSHDFVLKANNNNSVWIKTSGKVGVGEASPTAKFEVYESALLGSSSNNTKLITSKRANVSNNFMNNLWAVRDNTNASGWMSVMLHDGISVDVSFLTPGTDTRTWWQRHPYLDIQSWGTGATPYMVLKQSQLQVGQQTNAANSSTLCINVNGGSAIEVFDQATGTNGMINFKVKANGYAYAREINVMPANISFPDYVFEKNYKMLSIAEVEKYIASYKHLPNVPSAGEVKKEGINLGEMQVKQMEKIEEAFLYIIELKKENEELKSRIEILEKQK